MQILKPDGNAATNLKVRCSACDGKNTYNMTDFVCVGINPETNNITYIADTDLVVLAASIQIIKGDLEARLENLSPEDLQKFLELAENGFVKPMDNGGNE